MKDRRDELDRAIDAVFGDGSRQAGPAEAAEDRLVAELKALDRLLKNHRRIPAEAHRQHLWTRLETRLEADRHRRLARVRLRLAVAIPLVAAALVLVVLTVGRSVTPAPQRTATAGSAPTSAAPELELATRLARLLDRSEPLLLAISNRPGTSVLAPERDVAAELSEEWRSLAADHPHRLRRGDRQLVAELSAVMLQLANAEHRNDLELVRAILEDRHILTALALRASRREAGDRHSADGRSPRNV